MPCLYIDCVIVHSGRSAVRLSAPASGVGGRRFKSSRPDHSMVIGDP